MVGALKLCKYFVLSYFEFTYLHVPRFIFTGTQSIITYFGAQIVLDWPMRIPWLIFFFVFDISSFFEHCFFFFFFLLAQLDVLTYLLLFLIVFSGKWYLEAKIWGLVFIVALRVLLLSGPLHM